MLTYSIFNIKIIFMKQDMTPILENYLETIYNLEVEKNEKNNNDTDQDQNSISEKDLNKHSEEMESNDAGDTEDTVSNFHINNYKKIDSLLDSVLDQAISMFSNYYSK